MMVAQHYFEVLRTLIQKKSIFAQQVVSRDSQLFGEILQHGAKVELMIAIQHLLWLPNFLAKSTSQDHHFITTMIQYQLMGAAYGPGDPLPYQFIMGPCTVEGWWQKSRLVSQPFENTFVWRYPVPISPHHRRGRRGLHHDGGYGQTQEKHSRKVEPLE